jgi:hypothetical protein
MQFFWSVTGIIIQDKIINNDIRNKLYVENVTSKYSENWKNT